MFLTSRLFPAGLAAGLLAATLIINSAPAQEVPATGRASTQDAPASLPSAASTSPTGEGAPGTIEFRVTDTPLQQVFQMLSVQGNRNIIATKEVTGKVTCEMTNVTFKEALEAVLQIAGYVYEENGNFIYVMTPEQLTRLRDASRKTVVRTFRLGYVTAADAKSFIAPALSKNAEVASTPQAVSGIPASPSEAGGNSNAANDMLIVRDYEENLDKVAEILAEVDVRPEQVLIEATILRTTLNENNALGVDFNTLAGVDFEGFAGNTLADTDLKYPGATNLTNQNTPSGTFRTDFTKNVPTGGATFGFIGNETAVFVRALESVTDTTVLANPKLLVVNKQRGEVMIGNRDGYLTTTVTETVATQTVQFLETGTRLVVRPYIGKNGYIRLELHPEDSSGSVSQVGTSVLPSETTTEVTSNVLVRDGHTIVIGGLFRERTIAGRSQTPLIGNIPVVGAAFRSTNDATVREEMIILITPRIIRQSQDEATSEQIKNDVERFRIGGRKGLRWWGRSRLAQHYVHEAREAIVEGNESKARCNIDLALSLDTRMIEAIRIKERLTDKAYWSCEARESSVRYLIEQMMMQEMGLPVERVVPRCKPRDVELIAPAVRRKFNMEKRYEDPLDVEAMCGPYPKCDPVKDPVFKAAAESADLEERGPAKACEPTAEPADDVTPLPAPVPTFDDTAAPQDVSVPASQPASEPATASAPADDVEAEVTTAPATAPSEMDGPDMQTLEATSQPAEVSAN